MGAVSSPMVTAKRKAWIARCRTRLVGDGHPDAIALFAVPGRPVKLDTTTRFENAAEFFAGIPDDGKKTVEEAKPKRGRPTKVEA